MANVNVDHGEFTIVSASGAMDHFQIPTVAPGQVFSVPVCGHQDIQEITCDVFINGQPQHYEFLDPGFIDIVWLGITVDCNNNLWPSGNVLLRNGQYVSLQSHNMPS